ncbi:CHAP domain-containing protein [Acinetobacter sp. LoGeW2-3]|uniref:CHAP domain-containing protein n=1 Tax=Acinetobacter sp. LoGeW2-3 TaxID=1808001 RepID=UPI000C05912D|nr:CHAP domain-containing protein [Acinetobacter sp. LoGeW2-3]ATO18754.1 CHAP domain-containing protein [Acinetobacter sp. LoGeW2-3]
MIYDHQVNMSEVHAPVQANVIIRSQSGKNSKGQSQRKATETARNKTSESRKTFSVMNGQRFDIEKFTNYLQGITRNKSTQMCARSIRIGLQSSGAKIVNHPVAAADWGSTLQQLGYRKINLSFDRPKKGDIYIIDRTSQHKYGHIAAYSGSAWVSDFRQAGYAVYRSPEVKYTYYRLDNTI